MRILYLLEGIRTPFLNTLLSIITYLGSEVFLLVGSLVILWTIDKKWGYYLLFVASIGATINQFIKNLFAIARPWVIDPEFTVVEQAKATAGGYSFPSGHTQTAVGFFGGIMKLTNNKKLKIIAILMIAMVAFSRMYLGVHTFYDVSAAIIIGTILVIVIYPLFFKHHKEYHAMISGVIMALIYIIYIEAKYNNVALDEMAIDAIKNAYTLFGLSLAIPVIYFVDTKYLNYPIKAVWWAQLVKCLFGFGFMFAIRTVLKEPFYLLIDNHYLADAIRYFIIAISGGLLWPMTFKWFSKLS